MDSELENYFAEIENLGIKRQIPLSQLARAFNASRQYPKKNKVIRDRLVGHYLAPVGKFAKRLSKALKVDLEYLIGEGNLFLCEFFSEDKPLRSDFSAILTSTFRSELRKKAIDKILYDLDMSPLPDNLPAVGEIESLTEFNSLEEFDEGIKSLLHQREYLSLKGVYPFDGEKKTLKEIGGEIGLTRSRVKQIVASAERKIFDAYGVDLYNVFSQNHEFESPQYSDFALEKLNENLWESRGITLEDMADSLEKQEFLKFVRGALGVKIKSDNATKLIKKYEEVGSYGTRLNKKERREMFFDLHEKIIKNLGLRPLEFMSYFNLTRESFIEFAKERFSVSRGALERVISFDNEKGLSGKKEDSEISINELELLERVLNLLEKDENRTIFNLEGASDKIKHALFPRYINDPEACLKFLEEKIGGYEREDLQRPFREAYDFFNGAKNLEIESLRKPLDEFQKVDVITMANSGRHILASDTGVGKSLEMIATAEYLGVDKVLIITNKTSVEATWKKEIEKHLGEEALTITSEDKEKSTLFEQARRSKWIVSNYDTYRANSGRFKELNPEMVVVDEADIMNNPDTRITKAILEMDSKYRYCVSGWVFKNRRSELWPLLNWLHPKEYPFRRDFVDNYCTSEWGKARLKYELGHKLIHRPKSLVLPDLPELRTNEIRVRMTPEQRKNYREIERNFIKWFKEVNKDKHPNAGVSALAKLHAMRRSALQPKFATLHTRLKRRHGLQKFAKSVVFCSYVDEAMRIAEELSGDFGVGYFDGQTTLSDRTEAIYKFNNDEGNDILVMTEAGGKSIELTAANYIYMFNPVWTYSMKKQIIDRLHRRGQRRIVYANDIITRGTLEDSIARRVNRKRREYEETVTDSLGYTAWFEENQQSIMNSVVRDVMRSAS